jgi:hypothetical protein
MLFWPSIPEVSMRLLHAFLFSSSLMLPAIVLAQTEQAPPNAPQKAQEYYVVPDGGVSQRLHSVFIPPKLNAPFSLILQTEWERTLADGGTITLVNQRKIARDSKGRIYQERWTLVPKNGDKKSEITMIQVSSPETHVLYNCAEDGRQQCVKLAYEWSSTAEYRENEARSGELPSGKGSVIHDDLGKQLLEGVEAEGTRISTIYNPGVFGNDRQMTVQTETWFSSQLGFNLLSVRTDPRFGKQTFTVTNLILSEPDPKLFELPQGFAAAETREPAP